MASRKSSAETSDRYPFGYSSDQCNRETSICTAKRPHHRLQRQQLGQSGRTSNSILRNHERAKMQPVNFGLFASGLKFTEFNVTLNRAFDAQFFCYGPLFEPLAKRFGNNEMDFDRLMSRLHDLACVAFKNGRYPLLQIDSFIKRLQDHRRRYTTESSERSSLLDTPTDTGRSFTFTAQRAIRYNHEPTLTQNLPEMILEVGLLMSKSLSLWSSLRAQGVIDERVRMEVALRERLHTQRSRVWFRQSCQVSTSRRMAEIERTMMISTGKLCTYALVQ
uniref:Uncharacterized protein n=1 Tax=Ascaris lumbricoides TaxID=6252 RepID=A0A9J2P4G3_ASCLU